MRNQSEHRNTYKHDYATVAYKVRNKLWNWFNPSSGSKGRRLYLYPAYYRLLTKKKPNTENQTVYLTQKSHLTSGIGVNFENIYSGFCTAIELGVEYAYSPLPNETLNQMLAMGEGVVKVQDLLAQGYHKVRLPYFSWEKEEEVELIKKMIQVYQGEKVVFYLEDQQLMPSRISAKYRGLLANRFWNATIREQDPNIYSSDAVHIAIHIRRGHVGELTVKPGLEEWWLDNSYYTQVIEQIKARPEYKDKKVELFIISEGEKDLFTDIEEYAQKAHMEVHYILNETIAASWLYMIKAEVLLTGPSSFSYNAALFYRGLKVSPQSRFYYPKESDWLVAEKDGTIIER